MTTATTTLTLTVLVLVGRGPIRVGRLLGRLTGAGYS